ncbi:hypothetical protein BJF82_03740 [Kytococcus sp. CUA-901]|nr:hypothetical protein BJF82_03740 [Kytococcus sp. CUA-901]
MGLSCGRGGLGRGSLRAARVSSSLRSGVRPVVMRSTKRSNRYSLSCGPAAASGWYCTEKAGRSRHSSPSTTSSLRHTWETHTRPRASSCGAVTTASSGASTANPWFWAVISTLPVVRSMTGWLMPRWPKSSL